MYIFTHKFYHTRVEKVNKIHKKKKKNKWFLLILHNNLVYMEETKKRLDTEVKPF